MSRNDGSMTLHYLEQAGASAEILEQLRNELAPAPSPQATSAPAHEGPDQLATAHPLFGLLLASAAVYSDRPKLTADSADKLTVYLEGSLRVQFDLTAHTMQYLVGRYAGKLRPVRPLTAHEAAGLMDVLSGIRFV